MIQAELTLRATTGQWPRRLPYRGVAQVAGILWIYAFYDAVRAWLTSSPSAAYRHGRQVARVEHVLGVGFEREVQQAVLHVRWLMVVCNLCYSLLHVAAPIVVLVVLYRHAPGRYEVFRDALMAMLGLALLCFWLFPLMPPRLMPGSYHFADTSMQYFNLTPGPLRHALGVTAKPTLGRWRATNPYAAMPSLHVGWAVWAALAMWPLTQKPVIRALLVAYPAAIFATVTVTANHWLLDSAGALVVLAAARGLAALCQRMRRSRRTDRPLSENPPIAVSELQSACEFEQQAWRAPDHDVRTSFVVATDEAAVAPST